MKELVPFHHYNLALHSIANPVELLEERVVQLLLNATVTDGSRDSSIAFELKHSAGVLQFGRLLAAARDLPRSSASAGALLHDIYVITEGRYRNHAHLGAPIARRLMEEVRGFSETEIQEVETIVYHHSDKHVVSADPLVELGKDADVLDSFLYPGAFDYYLLAKPLESFIHYLTRAKTIWRELGLQIDPAFSILDSYQPGRWLTTETALSSPIRSSAGSSETTQPFAVLFAGGQVKVFQTENERFTGTIEALARSAMTDSSFKPEEKSVLVVWPAIERWQLLSWGPDTVRLEDLGLTNPDSKE